MRRPFPSHDLRPASFAAALFVLTACGGGGGGGGGTTTPPAPAVTVTVTPGSASLSPGGTAQFNATVANASNTAVTWSVQEGGSGGTVTASGLYTAPATIPGATATYHVVATSVADSTKSATATLTVTSPPVISAFTATPSVILPGGSCTLSWAVTNATTLSINQGVGTVSGTSTMVSPSASTLYTLTAANAAGSVNQSVAVTVAAANHSLAFLAGSLGGPGTADGPSSAARFNSPGAVVTDPSGTTYVLDVYNYAVRAVALDGTVTTVVGTPGLSGYVNATGTAARLHLPQGLARDPSGNLYVTEFAYGTVRKITPAGVVSTFAGGGPSGADGLGTAAGFNHPTAAVCDSAGNLYVTDSGNCTIRKITPSGQVSTLAGAAGQVGSQDGTGASARFNYPQGLAVDSAGNVFVADEENFVIRKITPAGVVTTVAGTAGQFGSTDGNAATARLGDVVGVAVDPSGTIYFSDRFGLRKVATDGTVSTVYASGGFLGLGQDLTGNILVADYQKHVIWRISPSASRSVYAGTPTSRGYAEGTGEAALFNGPQGVAVSPSGTIYVADAGNAMVRAVTPGGTTSAYCSVYHPRALALDSAGYLYVADDWDHVIYKVAPGGSKVLLAGTKGQSGSVDGNGTAARFKAPAGVAVDASGNLYVSDNGNHTIRKVTPAGDVTTLAGSAGQIGNTDGVGAAARLTYPTALALSGAGDLYVIQDGVSTIRKVTPGGAVTTLAGSGSQGSSDGQGTAASFINPGGLAWDAMSGNLFVADTYNHTIRVVTLSGAVTTLAGQAGQGTAVMGALPGRLAFPRGIAAGVGGKLTITMEDGLVVLNP